MSLLCPFAKTVWNLILSWEHFDAQLILPPQDPIHLSSWWEEVETKITKGERKCGGINLYTLMARHGPHPRRWFDLQDEDVRRTALVGVHLKTTRRYCTKYDILLVILSLHSI
jgi:hypothetical protein